MFNKVEEVMVRIGVDMVEIDQLARRVRQSPAFGPRTFSRRELGAAGLLPQKRRDEYLAGRFAVKEAALKALGVGLAKDLRLSEIETVSLPSGAPKLAFRGNVSRFAKEIGVRGFRVSISHESGFAVAFVLLSSNAKLRSPRPSPGSRNRTPPGESKQERRATRLTGSKEAGRC